MKYCTKAHTHTQYINIIDTRTQIYLMENAERKPTEQNIHQY